MRCLLWTYGVCVCFKNAIADSTVLCARCPAPPPRHPVRPGVSADVMSFEEYKDVGKKQAVLTAKDTFALMLRQVCLVMFPPAVHTHAVHHLSVFLLLGGVCVRFVGAAPRRPLP